MMAKGGSKVQEQGKIVKKKKTLKARLKKDDYNPPELEKVKKKSSEIDIRSPRDRIRHLVAQKGSHQIFHCIDSLNRAWIP